MVTNVRSVSELIAYDKHSLLVIFLPFPSFDALFWFFDFSTVHIKRPWEDTLGNQRHAEHQRDRSTRSQSKSKPCSYMLQENPRWWRMGNNGFRWPWRQFWGWWWIWRRGGWREYWIQDLVYFSLFIKLV